jgi:site-specific recombinase XerD
VKPSARVDRAKLHQIDLHWHDLRHEGACRLLADGVDIRIIQLMIGHASVQQTQRYLNVTDEELRKGLEVKVAYVGQAVAYGREESDRSTP